MMRRAALRRRAGGSAAVEFVTLAPFVLILSALLWDLRAYVSHRTDLAREVHVVAELIAAEADASPLVPSTNPLTARFLDAFMDRFAAWGAGSIDVAVVARGTTRRNGAACPALRSERSGGLVVSAAGLRALAGDGRGRPVGGRRRRGRRRQLRAVRVRAAGQRRRVAGARRGADLRGYPARSGLHVARRGRRDREPRTNGSAGGCGTTNGGWWWMCACTPVRAPLPDR